MYRYCRCGYPLLVAATWTGHDYHLVPHDSASAQCRPGRAARDSPLITSCPQCGQALVVRELGEHPPQSSGPPLRRPEPTPRSRPTPG